MAYWHKWRDIYFCSNCGRANKESSLFCPYCHQRMENLIDFGYKTFSTIIQTIYEDLDVLRDYINIVYNQDDIDWLLDRVDGAKESIISLEENMTRAMGTNDEETD